MSSKRGRGPTCPERAKAGSKDDTAQTRRSGLGALPGYVGGLGVGTGCGLIRPSLGGGSKLRAGIVLALAVMAGSRQSGDRAGCDRSEKVEPQQLDLPYRFSPRPRLNYGGCP